MFSVNPDQLKDLPAQITRCSDVVEGACDRLNEIRSVIMQMETLESAIPKIAQLSSQLMDEVDSLTRMSRTLDMITAYYRRCETRIRNNCSGTTKRTYRAKTISIPGLPRYLTGNEE